MERIITSIKVPVLALAGKYLLRSRKIQRRRRCVVHFEKLAKLVIAHELGL